MMEKLLQREVWIRIFSVALAILLWVIVMQDYMAETSRSFEVPLSIQPNATLQVYEGPQPKDQMSVEVRAVGRKLVVSRLQQDELKAVVDYSKITEIGKPVQAEIRVEGPKRAAESVTYHVTPKTITVTLVENGEKQVPVFVNPKTDIVSYQGREYRVTAATAQAKVTVIGRSDFLANVRMARVSLDPKDLVPSNAKVTKQIEPLDEASKRVERLNSTYMDVNLTWELLPSGKAVKVAPITRGTLPKGYTVSSIEVTPSTVTLRAATLDGSTPATDAVETAPIDLTDKTRTFTATVGLLAPRGSTLTVESATVVVTIGEGTAEKVFKGVPITVTGKQANTDVTVSVTDVLVRIKGTYSIVTPMEASAITGFVDVEGLREGKHLLPIRLSTPQGVEGSTDPSVVEVTIVNK